MAENHSYKNVIKSICCHVKAFKNYWAEGKPPPFTPPPQMVEMGRLIFLTLVSLEFEGPICKQKNHWVILHYALGLDLPLPKQKQATLYFIHVRKQWNLYSVKAKNHLTIWHLNKHKRFLWTALGFTSKSPFIRDKQLDKIQAHMQALQEEFQVLAFSWKPCYSCSNACIHHSE